LLGYHELLCLVRLGCLINCPLPWLVGVIVIWLLQFVFFDTNLVVVVMIAMTQHKQRYKKVQRVNVW
jgi:hypothetical protein